MSHSVNDNHDVIIMEERSSLKNAAPYQTITVNHGFIGSANDSQGTLVLRCGGVSSYNINIQWMKMHWLSLKIT